MSDKTRHLEPYGYNTDYAYEAQKCCCNADNGKDKEQDARLGRVDEELAQVAGVINGCVDDITELSGKVETIDNEILSINERDDNQDAELSELSKKVDTCVSISSMTELEEAVVAELRDDFYTKQQTNEIFATVEMISGLSNDKADATEVEELRNKVEQLHEATDSLTAVKADKETVNAQIDTINQNVVQITDTLNQNLVNVTNNLISQINATTSTADEAKRIADTAYMNDKYTRELVDKSIEDAKDLSDEITSNSEFINNISAKVQEIDVALENKADISYVDEKNDEVSNLSEEVSEISAKIDSYDAYVKSIANEKADLSDFNELSNDVKNLENEVESKANISDLNEVKENVENNNEKIEALEQTKQDAGDYVSVSMLNDYYTKDEAVSKDDLSTEMAKKQPLGNYVSAATLDNYYTKAETTPVSEFNDFKTEIEAEVNNKADKEALATTANKANTASEKALEALSETESLTNKIELVNSELNVLNSDIEGLGNSISNNTTLISKIADINNLSSYVEGGRYVNNGNGVLDVLHKKFHLLINGLDESDSGLLGVLYQMQSEINNLKERITKLENN